MSCPNAASRGKVFCQSFRRKAGRLAKTLRRIFDHRHTHTAGTKSDAPGRVRRRLAGYAVTSRAPMLMCTPKVGHNIKGAFMRKITKTQYNYSANFKLAVILDVIQNGLCIHDAVRKYWNVTSSTDIDKYRSTVRRWKTTYENSGKMGFMKKDPSRKQEHLYKETKRTESSMDAELARLRAENEDLRMENDFLKKLRALILKEEQRKNCK